MKANYIIMSLFAILVMANASAAHIITGVPATTTVLQSTPQTANQTVNIAKNPSVANTTTVQPTTTVNASAVAASIAPPSNNNYLIAAIVIVIIVALCLVYYRSAKKGKR